jgi:type 1 fimbria pilin
LAAGAVVNSGQKTFEITVTCQKNALSSNQTFVPQFSPRKSAVFTGSHVALNDGTDDGVGFKLFDFAGTALPFNTPLSAFPNSQFDMSPAFVPVTWPYTIKYAKTSKAVISGTVTSSIMITFSVL